jgi:hypothetical protein
LHLRSDNGYSPDAVPGAHAPHASGRRPAPHTCQKMIGGKTGMGSPGSRQHVSIHVSMGVALTLWTALILACSQARLPVYPRPQGMIS